MRAPRRLNSSLNLSRSAEIPIRSPSNPGSNRISKVKIDTSQIQSYVDLIFAYIQDTTQDAEIKKIADKAIVNLRVYDLDIPLTEIEGCKRVQTINFLEEGWSPAGFEETPSDDELAMSDQVFNETGLEGVFVLDLSTEVDHTPDEPDIMSIKSRLSYKEKLQNFINDYPELELSVKAYSNESRYYCGTVKEGKPHGYGRLYDTKNRIIFEGCFILGKSMITDQIWVTHLKAKYSDDAEAMRMHNDLKECFKCSLK
jgi:hypothetical protein